MAKDTDTSDIILGKKGSGGEDGGDEDVSDGDLEDCAGDLIQAVKKGDKKAVVSALKALTSGISASPEPDGDEEPEEEDEPEEDEEPEDDEKEDED